MRAGKTFVVIGLTAAIWGLGGSVSQAQPILAIDGMYRNFLGRPMEVREIQYWRDAIRSGTPALDIQGRILASDEYFRNSGGRPRPWIRSLYNDLLNRDPRPREVDYWMDRLTALGNNREAMAREFSYDADRDRRNGRRW